MGQIGIGHLVMAKQNYYNILDNPDLVKNILKYLSPIDAIYEMNQLVVVNKKTNQILTNPDTYTYEKYMLSYYKDYYLFVHQKKNELKVFPKILETIKESDNLYTTFYKRANTLVVIYYFSGLFLILDIFVLLLILYIKLNFWNVYPHIPIMIFWFSSLLVLVVNYILKIYLEENMKKITDEKLPLLDEKTKKKLLKNISYRLRNQQPVSYKLVSFLVILCYIPIFCKFLTPVNYKWTCLIVASVFSLTFFFRDLIKMSVSKYNNSKEIIYDYKFIFNQNEFFKKKIEDDIRKKEVHSCFDERLMIFFDIFWKIIIFILIIFYARLVGKKIDDPNYNVNWRILLIPVDLFGVLLILWGILYMCSTKEYKMKGKYILYISLIIMLIGAGVNIIIFPNILDSQKNLNLYLIPFIVDLIISACLILYYCTLKKIRNTDNTYELD